MDVKDILPVSMQLQADPESNIWYLYNTLTCTAYLDGHKILIVLTIKDVGSQGNLRNL